MNRSKLPKIARWMTTGRCSALSAPMYFRSKRSGMLVVELDRRALPLPADGVGDVEVDLRAVERAVALVERVGQRRRASSAALSSASAWSQVAISPRNSAGRVDELGRRTAGRSRRTRAGRAGAAARLPRRSAPPSRSSAHRPARTAARGSGPTARPTPRCGAAASARESGAAGRDSSAPRSRRRACGPGSSSASRSSSRSSDSTRNMFWR